MNTTPAASWFVLAAVVGVAAGSAVWVLPAPLLAALVVGAVLCFGLAVAMTSDPPKRWEARTVSGRRVSVRADADRVLMVAGEALQQAGVQRLERWPGELIASRDSLGGSEHVEVRLRSVDGVVHVDVRSRGADPTPGGADVVDHVVSALQAM
jgi:hypothetical protein